MSFYICHTMKRKEMQDAQTTGNNRAPLHEAQALNALRLRAISARGGFLALGTEAYTPLVEVQAAREGLRLTNDAKLRIRQIMNGNVRMGDAELIELIERAVAAQTQNA